MREPGPGGESLLFLTDEQLRKGIEAMFFAYRGFTADPDRILDGMHYGRAHHRALHFIHRSPGTTVNNLLNILGVTKQSLNRVLKEQARILRPGGYVAFEVGEVRNGKVLLEKLVWRAADGLPFERLGVVVNDQEFTKTANCWGVSNNKGGTNSNRIVVLKRVE